jgi:hypothetical protein
MNKEWGSRLVFPRPASLVPRTPLEHFPDLLLDKANRNIYGS